MPEVVPPMIALSLRQPDAEAVASDLGLEDQLRFLDKFAELSIRGGVRPMLEMMVRILLGQGEGGNGLDRALAGPGGSPALAR